MIARPPHFDCASLHLCRLFVASVTASADDFTARMLAAVNAMMLDVLAAVARKDVEDRRRRQAEGTAKAKVAGVYKGRRENAARNEGIATMLRTGSSWQQIQGALGCSKGTIAKVRKRLNAATTEQAEAEVSRIS